MSVQPARAFALCAVASGLLAAWLVHGYAQSARRAAAAPPRVVIARPAAPKGRFRLRRGERAVTVDARLDPAGAEARSGDTIDLVASGGDGDQDSRLLLAGAEVLQGTTRSLTLRVRSDQIAAVISADVFARELRAIIRP
ncbi:MAG: hypothetical protein ACRDKI_11270 [Solirubrobacterales bacterium]